MLAKRPVQIMRGGPLDKGTIYVISWTRRNGIHVASIYNAHEGDPQPEDATRRLFEQLQEYVAEIGGVPRIAGDDWNLEPRDAEGRWGRRQAIVHDVGAATQKHGRNIEGIVAGLRAPTWGAEAKTIPGTEHVGVQIKLQAVDAKTLGLRMEEPRQIKIDKAATEGNAKYK